MNELEFKELVLAKDEVIREKIMNKFFGIKRGKNQTYWGEDQAKEIEKRIFLQAIDLNWKSHIQYLEQLKTSNWT